jgi:HNH endonuclease
MDIGKRRRSVTGSRDALNGYQKGKCFYCLSDIHIDSTSELYPEVDHFFPHTLKQHGFDAFIDGIWNLVLSCRECNRGVGGKFDRIPTIRLLSRLHERNEFLISSHHPLRETLIQQTGESEDNRAAFLNDCHSKAWAALIHLWEPEEKDAFDYL